MNNQRRLNKLEEAVRLIREVEFSYETGTHTRAMMYKVMVDKFSLTDIGLLMTRLKKSVQEESRHIRDQRDQVDMI